MSNNNSIRNRGSGERGSAMVEFVLCMLLWVPFFLGMWMIGINLIRAIEVTEVCRDAAHMSAFGIDFSTTGNQAVLQKVAQGIDISATGSGVVILSTVTMIGDSDCTAAGLDPNGSCTNNHQHVFTRQIIIGNSSVRASAFGTPKPGDIDSNGNIAPGTYLTDTTCVAKGFSNLMTLASGQYAYMAEMTVNSPDLSNAASSARSIF